MVEKKQKNPKTSGLNKKGSRVKKATAYSCIDHALQESPQIMTTLIESAMDAIISVDSEYKITIFNRAAAEMFLCPVEQALGRFLSEFIPQRFRQHHDQHIQHFAETGITTRRMGSLGTISGLRSNGEEFPLEASISQCVVSGKRIFTVILRDVTERIRSQKMLSHMATVLEQMAELVVVTDLEGRIVMANQACELISGYSRDELLGKTPRIFKSGQHSPEFFENMWKSILQGETWSGQITNRKKDGNLAQESMTISPVRDKEGKIINFVSIRRDISKQLKLEEQIQHSQKMESIGRLAGGVAHDFNNLLTVINGTSELLLYDLPTNSPARAQVKEILHAGTRAAQLTRQLLTFSRRQVVAPQICDINRVVVEMKSLLQRLIGEDIKLLSALDPALQKTEIDPGQLEQIVVNLAVNARDAMPEGGTLILETANVELDEGYTSRHAGMNPGQYVMLAITDTGKGIPPEIRSKIFEPFFTTKELGKGTGLGLSTVYGIVDSYKGNIWVYSEMGKGTVFKIYFPANTSPPESARATTAPVQLRGDNQVVLLVEDEESVRRLGKAILERAGYQVYEARDGKEALEMITSTNQKIDLLITDVIMPKMSGRQLVEEAQQLIPQVKVLFISGYTDQIFAHTDDLAPGMAFVQKPFSTEEILKKIRLVLNSAPSELEKNGSAKNANDSKMGADIVSK
jgi:two-component system, cell cycle sensor histidine kinase and response regulator CckA